MISLCSLTFCNTTKIKQQKKRFLWVHRIQLFFVSIYYVWINRKAKELRIQFQVSLASNYLKRFTATRCLIEKEPNQRSLQQNGLLLAEWSVSLRILVPHQTFTCSLLTIYAVEKSVKYLQRYQWRHQNDANDIVLVSLLLTLNMLLFLLFTLNS